MGQAKTHRDALATAFDPLREQIEKLKNGFWENHGDTIRANIKNYVERKVKEKVAVEASRAPLKPLPVMLTGRVCRSRKRSNATVIIWQITNRTIKDC